jgi:hypothetical protein
MESIVNRAGDQAHIHIQFQHQTVERSGASLDLWV